jgi:DNA-binding transcriptional regulator GbsR (MarR family)
METLSPVAQRFILHWGEMGTRWGINRTVAQIHALLYLSQRPLSAEEIAATLSVARSNVSNSLKELQGWGVVRTVHELGDRRDRFESLKDVWEMFSIIMDERKRREIDPTLQMLRACVSELEEGGAEKYTRKRVEEMLEFFENVTSFYGEFRRLPLSAVRRLGKLKGKLRGLFGSTRAKEG